MSYDQGSLFGTPSPEPGPAKERPAKDPVDLPPAAIGLLRSRATACRLCGARIVFAITVKTVRGEERLRTMPVDLEPAPGGNVRLTMSGRNVRAYVIGAKVARTRQSLHHSHMETCPNKEQLKRGR